MHAPDMLLARAPAKINLTLHVLRRRGDGFHDLESVVAFAGVSDLLALDPSRPLALEVDGPTAAQAGEADDNLVLRATRALGERVPGLRVGAPARVGRAAPPAAAGRRPRPRRCACAPGAPGCRSTTRGSTRRPGRRGRTSPSASRPAPGSWRGGASGSGRLSGSADCRPCWPTPASMCRRRRSSRRWAWRAARSGGTSAPTRRSPRAATPVRSWRRSGRVATTWRRRGAGAALAVAPEIGDAIDALSETPGARLVRMSGSGSTCFALYGSRTDARQAAVRLRAARPGWWICATTLA